MRGMLKQTMISLSTTLFGLTEVIELLVLIHRGVTPFQGKIQLFVLLVTNAYGTVMRVF